ncbi:MAG TPA: beta-propeller fold lactonase family protein [Solirubrobacteraceae bacterium]|nr:beta-propeller fold lactonase family protein [Solirubrobacteraceae bacterium]
MPAAALAGLATGLGAAALLLGSGSAIALEIYGGPFPLAGAGGCLRDSGVEPPGGQVCAGSANGLAGAQALAVSPDGANVYVAGEGAVVALARNRYSGALQPALSPSARACVAASSGIACASDDAALTGADAVAVSPNGRFVYVGASDSASVSAFERGQDGVLEPVAFRVLVPVAHRGSARHASHPPPSVYFGCVAGSRLAGAPEPRCGVSVGGLNGVDALAISPDGRYLYAVSYGLQAGQDSVVALQIEPRSGALRPLPSGGGCWQSLPGSDCPAVAGLEGASAVTISPDGRFLYVASEVSGAVRGFTRNLSTGAITPMYGNGGCVSSGNYARMDKSCELKVPQLGGARSLALSPDGRELYVAAFAPGAVVTLGRNTSDGRLLALPANCMQAQADSSCPMGRTQLRGAAALALAPGGGILYVLAEGADALVELRRDPAEGTLTLTGETPVASDPLSGPVAIALSPSGENVYMASPFDNGVAALMAEE